MVTWLMQSPISKTSSAHLLALTRESYSWPISVVKDKRASRRRKSLSCYIVSSLPTLLIWLNSVAPSSSVGTSISYSRKSLMGNLSTMMVTNLVKVKAIIKANKSLRNRLILNINRSWSTKLGLTNRKTSNFTNKSSPKEVFEAVMSHLPRIVTIPFLTSNHRLLKTTKMTSLSLRFTRSSPLQLFQTLKLSSIIRERPLHSHLTK